MQATVPLLTWRQGISPLIAILFFCLIRISHCEDVRLKVVTDGTDLLGEARNLTCRTNDTTVISLWWSNELNETLEKPSESQSSYHETTYSIQNLSLADFGRYYCNAKLETNEVLNSSYDLSFNVKTDVSLKPEHFVKEGENTNITCSVKGYPSPSVIHWSLNNPYLAITNSSKYLVTEKRSNPGEISSTLFIQNATPKLNGTYTCRTADGKKETYLVVRSKPTVKIVLIKAVGKSQIYANWTVVDGNSKVTKINIEYFDNNNGTKRVESVDPTQSHHLLKNLSPESKYSKFSIIAENDVDKSKDTWNEEIMTLREDPTFVPTLYMKGATSDSVTVGWNSHQNITEYYNFYNVTVRNGTEVLKTIKAFENPFMVDKLKSGTEYFFQVQACSSYTMKCDGVSKEVNGTTMDGRPSAPRNLTIKCQFDQQTHESKVQATWDHPEEGKIAEYVVTLSGNASYYDEHDRLAEDRVLPSSKTILNNQQRQVEFTNQPPNTHIFISVCAKSRNKICGSPAEAACSTPESIPDSEGLSKAYWKAVQRSENQQIFFMVHIPRISQRNGTICCFRVVVVRLHKDQKIEDLPTPDKLEILSYETVHNGTNSGAYVAELLEPNSRNTIIGDEINQNHDGRGQCQRCWTAEDYISKTQGNSFRPSEHFDSTDVKKHKKRHPNSNGPQHSNVPLIIPRDGHLDSDSTYTAFLDVIVIKDKHERIRAQSRYFHPLRPLRVDAHESVISGVAIVGSLVVALVVVLMALMCVMRWRRKEPGDQEYGLSHSIQQWCRRLRGQQPIPSEEPPNLPSIVKDDLVAAYQERHRDSDLGFQQEFEKLPDRFCDRTSQASDHRDNSGKNRYPDIKAYDQTRVKLSTAEGASDYINANIVVGYKERKKFVCAQGPMESTVVDWWRMIWEQHVHFILMLTNVEEYNKTKCAKYWPSEGSTNYADFMVTHCSERRYSDYLLRHLKLSKIRSGSGNQEEGVREEREIMQYHYLVWKDFMAPEYPVGILRFIKRFNGVYGPDKGPILVHCSAGVGRTGTLVALDSMLQQLNEEGCVSIFNTICDLRHQRNYLVQSLKQYIFIYRALMEISQFGDTDIPVAELKSHIEKLKGTTDGKTINRMEEEFERLTQVIEDRKPFTVGASDENAHRNRHKNVIPYDRSRVHLSPMPGLSKEINTYINASFIEGYDNTEQFIIAQDPLEVTIGDFWRMIVEQNIRSIVMLSETGVEEKCPRYWPEKDQETSHDYIKVKYMQSQSFPFYYRREFTVTDTKTDHSCLVTQFQYNGWPMGEGEVPQIDRGIVELIDTTFKYKETLERNVGPMVVHCSDGADRSCIFVALAILAQQMMNESRVDVFSVVRKLRSQRQGLFRNFAQYEFIYRGLVTYAELHVSNGNAGH